MNKRGFHYGFFGLGLGLAFACSGTEKDARSANTAKPTDDAPDDTADDTDPSGPPTPQDPNPNNADDVATGACGNAPGQLFPPAAPWNQNIAKAPLDAESADIIGYLAQNHDTATRFQIDFSFRVLTRGSSDAPRAFTPNGDFYEGECDPAPIPLPVGGALEGESGYACESDGDCHLIVWDPKSCRLQEMWRAGLRGNTFSGGCQAVWQTDRVYPETLRGEGCTSADASGLPITPLLFNADEVAAGQIRHALRFILPNQHIRAQIYVRPGTHSTNPTSGPATAPPYAARLRLRAAVDTSVLTRGAKVVAQALKDYGMILVDGGNLTFTGQSDADTKHSWEDAGLGAQDLKGLSWNDFEVVELGPRFDYRNADCQRTPITE